MNRNKLIDAIGKIDDDYIEEAKEKKMKRKVNVFEIVGKLATVACALFLVLGVGSELIGLGASKSYMYESADEAYSEEYNGGYGMKDYDVSGSSLTNDITDTVESKVIVSANMTIQTKDIYETVDIVKVNISTYGGYIQYEEFSNGYYRHYSANIRIPSEKYSEFLNSLNENCDASFYSENKEDITDTYYDSVGRLENYKAEEARIQELYEKAENLSEVLEIESRLSEIRYQIEYYENRIKNYDLLTSYSTLSLDISETIESSKIKLSFFERIGLSFSDGIADFFNAIENLFLGIVYYIWVPVLGIVGYVIYRIIRKKKSKKNS